MNLSFEFCSGSPKCEHGRVTTEYLALSLNWPRVEGMSAQALRWFGTLFREDPVRG